MDYSYVPNNPKISEDEAAFFLYYFPQSAWQDISTFSKYSSTP